MVLWKFLSNSNYLFNLFTKKKKVMAEKNLYSAFTICSDNKDLSNLKSKSKNDEIKTIANKYIETYEDLVSNGKSFEDIAIELPKVNFCEPAPNGKVDNTIKSYPQISDLCENDREKIKDLIAEILRYKDDYKKKNEEYLKVIEENRKLSNKIIQLEQDLSAFKLGCKAKDNDLKFLINAHKIQENALKKQILEFQRTIMSMTKEKLHLEIDLQKLKKEVEYLSNCNMCTEREKEDLQRKFLLTRDKLKFCLKFNNRETVLKKIIKKTEDEKSSSDNITNNCYTTNNSEIKCSTGPSNHKLNINGKNSDLNFKDNALVSELFFLPTQLSFPDFNIFTTYKQ